jgi:predicted dinucleotide-binding enzyme
VRAVLVGFGAVGRRVATELLARPGTESLVVVHRNQVRAARLAEGLGERVRLVIGSALDALAGADVAVVAVPSGAVAVAREALRHGVHVVAVTAETADVDALLDLDEAAREAGRVVAVGAAMAPGLSCVLARFGAAELDQVEQVHVASFGTGGPACARRHHAALSAPATDWYDGRWRRRPGGSGRELVWFPDPIGGADCYRGRLADPALLVPAFPGATRVSARMAATRRDRLSAPLPMLRPPHPEGAVGATRVELRGWRGGAAESVVLGASGRPALVAATVASITARWAVEGLLARAGAAGLAELVDRPGRFLAEVAARGIALARFEGAAATAAGTAATSAPSSRRDPAIRH